MDEASQPQPLMHVGGVGGGNSARGGQRGGGSSGGGGGGGGPGFNIQNEINIQREIMWIKQDATQVRNAVILLEQEKDSLRKAIRKLKLENGRLKVKVKALQETVAEISGTSKENGVASEVDMDYDDLGRDFFLIGGIHDPLSLRFEVTIRDANKVEHKSAERYYWYKMAETFGDADAMKKIHQAPNVGAAEEAMKEIRNFDEEAWNKLKLKYWEEGQLLKLKQVRWIANLLVYTKTTYLAVASQDKFFGTGWRKNRQESNKPIFWDGLNEGGKALMKIRAQLKESHTWSGPYEEEETQKKFREMQRFVWRRIDPTKRIQQMNGGGSAGRGMIGRGGRGMIVARRYPTNNSYGNGPRSNGGRP
jgi:ribA/ribD-fused uncharacterized protein